MLLKFYISQFKIDQATGNMIKSRRSYSWPVNFNVTDCNAIILNNIRFNDAT